MAHPHAQHRRAYTGLIDDVEGIIDRYQRLPQPVRLTPAGVAYLDGLQGALEALQVTVEAIDEQEG